MLKWLVLDTGKDHRLLTWIHGEIRFQRHHRRERFKIWGIEKKGVSNYTSGALNFGE
jgi:hypothetical protein